MARIRSIKPEIWQSEQIADVSFEARLTFIGLISQADDDGRLKGSPRRIKGKVFPYDSMSPDEVDGWLTELADEGLIVRYEHAGEPFIELPTWHQHQKINRKTDSALPSHSDDGSTITHGTLSERSLPEGKGREGIKEGITEGSGQRERVRGREVTDQESEQAREIIAAFAAHAGQRFTSEAWTDRVVACLRAHPDLAIGDHLAILAAAFRDPWWDGPPTPAVLYGSVGQFERQLAEWRTPGSRPKRRKPGGPSGPSTAERFAQKARELEAQEAA